MPEPLRVRRLGEEDAAPIAEFFKAAAWDPQATPERAREMLRGLAADNPFEPGKEPPTVGVFVGSRLAGFVTTIPTQFWNGKEHAPGHWLKGYTVLEEFRNGPIAYLLLKEMMKHVGLVASMPVPLGARQLSTALGMRDLGAVHDYIAPLRPARILRRLDIGRFEHLKALPSAISRVAQLAKFPPFAYGIGALIGAGLTALRLPSTVSAMRVRTELGKQLPSEAMLDRLWVRARHAEGQSATRSGAYLRWRYEHKAQGNYCFASAWQNEDLVGLAVLAHPQRPDDSRIAGLGIGSVVDLVLDPACASALPGLLGVARRWAISANYDALLLTASHAALRGPLLRAGYLQVPGNVHLLLRDPGGSCGLSTDLNAWMVTRGDAWGDHV
jgi:hypothetical protein